MFNGFEGVAARSNRKSTPLGCKVRGPEVVVITPPVTLAPYCRFLAATPPHEVGINGIIG